MRAYLTRYKQFSEPFTNVLKMASADDVDLETCQNVEKMAGNFMEQIRLYVGVFLLLTHFTASPPDRHWQLSLDHCLLSVHGHISKTKQDRSIVTMEHC